METGDKKMIKKAITCLLIVMLAMMISGLQLANALLHHHDGVDYTYTYCQQHSTVYPCYAECNHDVYPGDPGNSEVGLGVSAWYGGDAYFNYAWWDFNAEFGNGDVTMITGLSIDPCVNANDHHYWTYYGQPQWTYVSGGGWAYWCNYVHYELNPGKTPVYITNKNSVEGSTHAMFYHPSDPPSYPNFGEIWQLDAMTQNPNGNPEWSFLTARH
jgi:hypothetical protein